MSKKIAIVGSGFAGLALAWHLSEHYSVTIISDNNSSCASEISAGLLHPYAGAKSKHNWRGSEGVDATLPLLEAASHTIGESVYNSNGILRIAISEEQAELFKACADKYSDVHWLSCTECQEKAPGVINRPGIFISSGITVHTDLYIKGLKLALANKGVYFENKKISFLNDLQSYSHKILCMGAGIFNIPDLPSVRLNQVKGQILQLPWPEELPPLPLTINSKIYMVMSNDNKYCNVGSTFERDTTDDQPDMEIASTLILPELYKLYPPLRDVVPNKCRSGMRITTPNHLPFIKEIFPNTWIFTGLGSKGLLYHSLFAKEFSLKIL